MAGIGTTLRQLVKISLKLDLPMKRKEFDASPLQYQNSSTTPLIPETNIVS